MLRVPIPDIPNPIEPILGGLGDAATGVAGQAFDAAMKAIWDFASELLGGALGIIDTYMSPNVELASGIMPIAGGVGATVLVVMAWVQTARGVISGGRGFARLFIGLAQYTVASIAGLGMLGLAVKASDAISHEILHTGLGVDSWQGINGHNSILENAVNGVSGVGLGLIALLCIIPAALGFLIEALARNAAIVLLAATIPIVAAGLISDATRKWFWTALRWAFALLMMTPAIALAVVIGMQLAEAAAGADGQQQGAVEAAVAATVAGMVLIVALCTPIALFKMFAFVDPNSASGAALRNFFSDFATGGGGGGGAAGSSEGRAEDAGESRFEAAWAAMSPTQWGAAAGNIAAGTSGILDAVGAGHPGRPESSRNDGTSAHSDIDDADDRDDDDSSAASVDTAPGGDSAESSPASTDASQPAPSNPAANPAEAADAAVPPAASDEEESSRGAAAGRGKAASAGEAGEAAAVVL